jgi:hypothetical protein
METHLSMMLLVCASLLISAFALSIGPEEEVMDEELFELRLLQASCIASCILSFDDDRGGGPLVEQIGSIGDVLIVVWTGADHSILEGGPLDAVSPIVRIISNTPDDLGCLLFIGKDEPPFYQVEGDVAVHGTVLYGGNLVVVALPIVRGGASFRGVAF